MEWFGSKKKNKVPVKSDAPAARPVRVADYLSAGAVWLIPPGLSREKIFADLLARLRLPDKASALEAIKEREEMGGTLIEPRVAIPHARLKGLTNIAAAIGIRTPETPASDGVRIFILFLSPAEKTKEHLLFLAAIAALFQVEGIVEALCSSKTPQEVLNKIREAEKGI